VLPINDDGSLGAYSDLVAMPGKTGPLKGQGGAQPHQVRFDPSGRFILVPDRGLDMVHVYGFDGKTGKLVPHEPGAIAARPAAGPRHIDWHPSKPYAYGTNEFDSTVTQYHWDADKGVLTPRHFVSATPDSFFRGNTPSGVWVAPSGRFVYISNRGHDSIGIFAVNPADGTLSPVGWESTQGKTPRYIGLSAAGDLLYVANQDSDTTVTFRIDQASGRLTPIGRIVATESPMCVLFL
jgi:6-phosphogluconolactonase